MAFQGREVTVGGDLILAVNGQRVADGSDLVRIVTNTLRPGEPAIFTVLRDGEQLDVALEPEERPAGPASQG
jgi:S1-C subfamily serine protease